MLKKIILSLFAILAIGTMATQAKVYTAAPFKDGLVLQQQTNAAIWGSAAPGSTITINTTWGTDPVTCKAGPDRKWRTTIPTPKASFDEQTITITDDQGGTRTIRKVLIGEVWLSSGQSNMDMPISGWGDSPIHNVDSIRKSADNYTGKLRIVTVPRTMATEEKDTCSFAWANCNSNTVSTWSTLSYFFATHLIDSLNVPVGIINASYSGSTILTWIPEDIIYNIGGINYNANTLSNLAASATPVVCYNAMIKPLEGYTLSGFIWYQGETNVGNTNYAYWISEMIKHWRKLFGGKNLPFYQVELAPYWYNDINGTNGAVTREQQALATYMLPNVRSISINDQILPSETKQIHPSHKLGVGQRLGDCALHDVYGYNHLKVDNPELKSVTFKGKEAHITFTHAEDGFNIQDNIKGFELSGSDGAMKTAEARVNGNEVIVTSNNIAIPKAVNYCFRNFLMGNLKNKAGLPVRPFRSNNSALPPILDTDDENILGLQGFLIYVQRKLSNYASGTDAGFTEQNYFDQFTQTYNNASAMMEGTPNSQQAKSYMEELDKYCNGVDEHTVPLTEGYYYIVSAYSDFKARQKVEKAFIGDSDGYLHWSTFASNMTNCVFKLTQASANKWYVQCIGNLKYLGAATSTNGKIAMSDTPTEQIFKNFSKGQWGIVSNSLNMELMADGHSTGAGVKGFVTAGGGSKNSPASWYLRKITDPAQIEKFEMSARKSILSDAIKEAKELAAGISVGKEIGDVTAEVMDNYTTSLQAAGEYITLTEDLFKERMAIVEKLQQDLLNARKYVEPNVWYYIQSKDEKLSGNVLYLNTPNPVGCDKWSNTADIALWGLYDSVAEQFKGAGNPFCMWRLVPVEGQKNTFALQNRATGSYLSKTLTKMLHGSSFEPTSFAINIIGHAQTEIISIDAVNQSNLPLYASSVNNTVTNQTGGINKPSAWNFVPVEDSNELILNATSNAFAIVCLPFPASNINPVGDYEVKTYTVTNNPENGVIGLSEKTEFKAGEPFVIHIVNPANTKQETVGIHVTTTPEFTQEALTVNGMTGILQKSSIKLKGAIYFNSKNEMKTAGTLSFAAEGFTGYINPTQIVDTGAKVDAYLGDYSSIQPLKALQSKSNIYGTDGTLIRQGADHKALKYLPKGVYIIEGEKVRN